MKFLLSVVSALGLLAISSSSAQTCPPTGFTSKPNLNPHTYFQGTWFTLKQVPVVFQPANNRYCISGKITPTWTDTSVSLQFYNGGSIGGVTGNRSTALLSGSIPDLSKPSQAVTGPRNGSYWVIEAGTYAALFTGQTEFDCDDYEWAIVSGGAPGAPSNGACLPGTGPTNAKGFWLLSRLPVVPQVVADKITAVAAAKGYDVSTLLTIPQEGCTYDAYTA